MAPMLAGELHRLARLELGPTLTSLGFRRAQKSSSASWLRPEGERWLVMWLQPYRTVDRSAGSRFTLELRLSSRPETGGDGYRKRVPALLTDDERAAIGRALVGAPGDPWFAAADETMARDLLASCRGFLAAAIDRFMEQATRSGT